LHHYNNRQALPVSPEIDRCHNQDQIRHSPLKYENCPGNCFLMPATFQKVFLFAEQHYSYHKKNQR